MTQNNDKKDLLGIVLEKPDNLDSIVKNKVHFIQEKASIGIEKFSEMV